MVMRFRGHGHGTNDKVGGARGCAKRATTASGDDDDTRDGEVGFHLYRFLVEAHMAMRERRVREERPRGWN
jgi:hypothetical protein